MMCAAVNVCLVPPSAGKRAVIALFSCCAKQQVLFEQDGNNEQQFCRGDRLSNKIFTFITIPSSHLIA